MVGAPEDPARRAAWGKGAGGVVVRYDDAPRTRRCGYGARAHGRGTQRMPRMSRRMGLAASNMMMPSTMVIAPMVPK